MVGLDFNCSCLILLSCSSRDAYNSGEILTLQRFFGFLALNRPAQAELGNVRLSLHTNMNPITSHATMFCRESQRDQRITPAANVASDDVQVAAILTSLSTIAEKEIFSGSASGRTEAHHHPKKQHPWRVISRLNLIFRVVVSRRSSIAPELSRSTPTPSLRQTCPTFLPRRIL